MKFKQAIDQAISYMKLDISIYDQYLDQALSQQYQYTDQSEITLYKSGKKIRPLMLLLIARVLTDLEPSERLPMKIYKAAVSIEMLHVASLIHDDIIDEANQRRGQITINKKKGVKIAILIGDLQFIQALRVFANELDSIADFEPMRHLLDVTFNLCIGELSELNFENKSFNMDLLRNFYFQVIERKTAQLFGITCEASPIILGSSKKAKYYLHQFGLYFGRSFQIMDDLKDCMSVEMSRLKGNFTDIYQKKFTLPIIEALKYVNTSSDLYRYYFCKDDSANINMEIATKEACNVKSLIETYNVACNINYEALEFMNMFPDTICKSLLKDITSALTQEI